MVPNRREDILFNSAMLLLFGGLGALGWHFLYPTMKLRTGGVEAKAEITAVVEGKDGDGDTKYNWHYRFKVPTLEQWTEYAGEVNYYGRPDDDEAVEVVYLPETPSVNAAKVDVFGRRFYFFAAMSLIFSLIAAGMSVELLKNLFGRR